MLMSVAGSALGRALDEWIDENYIRPKNVAEFYASALLKICGDAGVGDFRDPEEVSAEIDRAYRAKCFGSVPGPAETYHARSPESKIR